MSDAAWTWKDPGADNSQLELRYEPGNWGDVLKGTWAILTTGALIQERGAAPLRYLDPFAGAPDYPLVQATAERLAMLPADHPFARAQEIWAARGRLTSTAGLVVATAEAAGAHLRGQVFDAHETRRAAWSDTSLQVLELNDGAEALRNVSDQDLVLVDPYDLFDTWGGLLRPLFASGPQATVLLYLFNKAPRGAGQLRQYRALRRRLEECVGDGRQILVGRLPQDATLPRAYHEVLLIAPARLAGGLAPRLAEATRALARPLADVGAFEEASRPS
jgi:hypothetical protein